MRRITHRGRCRRKPTCARAPETAFSTCIRHYEVFSTPRRRFKPPRSRILQSVQCRRPSTPRQHPPSVERMDIHAEPPKFVDDERHENIGGDQQAARRPRQFTPRGLYLLNAGNRIHLDFAKLQRSPRPAERRKIKKENFLLGQTRCCHRRANDEPQPSELFFDLLSTRCQFVKSCSLAAWELRTHSSGMSAKLFRRRQIKSPQPMRNDSRSTLSFLSYLNSLVSSGDVPHLEAAPPNLGVSIPGLATSHNGSPGA